MSLELAWDVGPHNLPALDLRFLEQLCRDLPSLVCCVTRRCSAGLSYHVSCYMDPLCVPQILSRLGDRRVAIEREILALGESKKGLKDIMQHCRGFERAYAACIKVSAGYGV